MDKVTVYRFAYIDSQHSRIVSPDLATPTAIAAIGADIVVGSGVEVEAEWVGASGIVDAAASREMLRRR
jgi:hypothetical protein